MKKYLSVLILSVSLIPSVALASWWNPFTWFSSTPATSTTDTKTVALEQRIVELENKLNANGTNTPTTTTPKVSATTTPAATTPTTTKNIKSINPPVVNNSTHIQAQVQLQSNASITPTQTSSPDLVPKIDLSQATTNLVSAFNDFEVQVKYIISKYGYTSLYGLSGNDYARADTLNQIVQKIDSSLHDLKSSNPSQENIDSYTAQYNNLYSSFKNLGLTIVTQAQIQAQQAADLAAQQAAEQQASTSALKQLKIKIAELQEIRIEVVNFGSNLGYGMTPDQNEMRDIEDKLRSFQTFDESNMFPVNFWGKLSRYTQVWKQALTAVIDIEIARMNVEVQKAD